MFSHYLTKAVKYHLHWIKQVIYSFKMLLKWPNRLLWTLSNVYVIFYPRQHGDDIFKMGFDYVTVPAFGGISTL